jgi:hypothetical protein
MTIFNPNDPKVSIKLIYYREQIVEANYHRYIFKAKNNFAPRWEYIGIVSVVPPAQIDSGKYKHFVVRYINSSKLEDVVALLGVYEAADAEDNDIDCPQMKENWLSYLMNNPYMPTECKPVDLPGCVKSQELTRLFGATFNFLKSILLKFGFQVTIGELGYNRSILQSYKTEFKEFSFITSAVQQIEDMINKDNEVDQSKLIITSDIRPKPKCEDILDTVDVCTSTNNTSSECLSEADARALIKYMILHYLIDTKKPLGQSKIQGKRLTHRDPQ